MIIHQCRNAMTTGGFYARVLTETKMRKGFTGSDLSDDSFSESCYILDAPILIVGGSTMYNTYVVGSSFISREN